MRKTPLRRDMALFLVMIAAVAFGNGLSDMVFGNYFKDVYAINATQRAFIELPRELPGLLCALVISALSFWGDLRTALVAQLLSLTGLIVLGLVTPAFGVMLIFLFINSLGMHLFMPLQDAIGMSLAEPDQIGRRMGLYASLRTAVGFISGLMVFWGFRSGVWTFNSPVKPIFLWGCVAFAAAFIAGLALLRTSKSGSTRVPRHRIRFRRAYKNFYLLTILHGVQKQIAYVFGAWVVIDLLHQGADIMSLLIIVSSFLGIFLMPLLGRWMDRFGIRRMMFVDALTFIIIYLIYGVIVWLIADNVLPGTVWPAMAVYGLFVLDRLSMQIGVVKSVYLRSIAVSQEEVTAALSTGISLDHIAAILAAQLSGAIWTYWGPQWVFFFAGLLSLGNLYVAIRVPRQGQPEAVDADLSSTEASGLAN